MRLRIYLYTLVIVASLGLVAHLSVYSSNSRYVVVTTDNQNSINRDTSTPHDFSSVPGVPVELSAEKLRIFSEEYYESRHKLNTSLRTQLKLCKSFSVSEWQPKIDSDMFENISTWVQGTITRRKYYSESRFKRRHPCEEYEKLFLRTNQVISDFCTNCVHQSDLVTLVLPMTDSEQFWWNLRNHVERWGGPISVGLMINSTSDPNDIPKMISLRWEKYFNRVSQLSSVCFHIIYAKESYPHDVMPINALRNVAMAHAKTDLVLLAETDFITPVNMSSNIVRRLRETRSLILNQIYVLPLFHIHSYSKQVLTIPDTKIDLLTMWYKQQVQSMGDLRGDGHSPTDYNKYSKTDDIYPVYYRDLYEPYFIINRTLAPFYPEALLYGHQDKGLYVYILNQLGFQFRVLNPLFLLHPDHTRGRVNRPKRVVFCIKIEYTSLQKRLRGRLVNSTTILTLT